MRKAILLAVTTVLLAMLSFTGCSNGSGGSGGSGADFDSSKYYSKDNIDHYIKDASPRFVMANATIISANSGWATGSALAGTNTPFADGGHAAVVQLTYSHPGATATEDVSIISGVGDASDKHFLINLKNIEDGESRTVLVTLDAESGWNPTAVKWWAGTIPSGAEVDINSYIIFYDSSAKKP
jgi:hypothetical protein